MRQKLPHKKSYGAKKHEKRDVVGGDRKVFFRGPDEAVKLQPRHTTLSLFQEKSTIILQVSIIVEFITLCNRYSYGSRTPSMDRDRLREKPYGLVTPPLLHPLRHKTSGRRSPC